MKRFPLIVLRIICLSLAGCSATPSEQYQIAAVGYNGTSIALAVANGTGKIPPPTWVKIQGDEAIVRSILGDSYSWLQANPNLANTPGLALPPLQPFNVGLAVLGKDLNNLDLVPTTLPAGINP